MLAEFREFINRGNFIDLAVGFVMGVAVSGVVTSLVERVVMPLIGLLFGEPNFEQVLTFGGEVDGVPVGSVGAVITARAVGSCGRELRSGAAAPVFGTAPAVPVFGPARASISWPGREDVKPGVRGCTGGFTSGDLPRPR